MLVVVALVAVVAIFFISQFLNVWIQAMVSNAPVRLLDLVGMRLRKVNIRTVVLSRIRAVKAGMDIPTNALETHFLAGGRVPNVVSAMIAARAAKIELPWGTAAAVDLAGRDILDAVKTSVNPKVIDCPKQGGPRASIDGVAQDGIQIRATARVTVRTNLPRLVGGATEETIIARVGEGIVTAIGSALTHKAVLASPDNISKTVMAKGLDAATAFEILSIDIASLDVGVNIGAKLQADQAQADTRRFQAEAEQRRAMAVAAEQEFAAEVQKNKALITLAEAEVPQAMAEAFRAGRLGLMR